MSIHLVKQYWDKLNECLYTYLPEDIEQSKINKDTFIFLTTCGLPASAAPFMDFVQVQDRQFLSPDKIFNIEEPSLTKYLMLGNNGYGDPVCIDTEINDEIVYLNHDNDFQRVFINSNLEKFSQCIIVYKDFISAVNKEDNSNWLNNRIEEFQLRKLKEDLHSIDKRCLDGASMWAMQLDR